MTDVSARIENILGFIEPYRDLAGIRSEWEAMIGIADADEVEKLKILSTARLHSFDSSHGRSRE